MPTSRAPATPATSVAPSIQMMTPTPGPPGPQGPPGAPGDSTESLEQRIYDLLAPVREMEKDQGDCYIDPSGEAEPKALILCENIAFLIRHNYSAYGKRIEPNDISLATKNWSARKANVGTVGIAIFVNANGYSNTILRALIESDSNVIDKLSKEVDMQLEQFFPNL